MSEYVFKLPDLGEGMVEAEIVAWHVGIGEQVEEGQVIVDVMTDKANVEVPAPVKGRVLRTSGEPGDLVAVGAELMALETESGTDPESTRPSSPAVVASGAPEPEPVPAAKPPEPPAAEALPSADAAEEPEPRAGAGVITSPAIRRRAQEAGVDLTAIAGSGPRGRILRRDLEAHLAAESRPSASAVAGLGVTPSGPVEETKVIGVRRVIAERMSQSKREIPHYSYVEEVDVTELEKLRQHLNARRNVSLTVLPFVATALIAALARHPQCNAKFDAEAGVLKRFRAVHLGIATQTADGLKVPVVHDADARTFWQLVAEIGRVTEAARGNAAMRGELVGSTVTLTSLGRMGGIVTTPVINYPEVAIVGINKAVERPMVIAGEVAIRTMMNLSGSFDHRFVDGFDAASLIQEMKTRLEHPATLFLPAPDAFDG